MLDILNFIMTERYYNRHSLGGQAMAIIQKQQALERYYANPNICKCCNKIIEVKEGERVVEVRIKKFCNSSCSATYNNRQRIKKVKPIRIPKVRIKKERLLVSMTKGELFSKRLNWQSARSEIQQHSRLVLLQSGTSKQCKVCGYTNHVEVCHIKSVKDFDNDATIAEINCINNLVYLCPNHHWEFDNGVLILRDSVDGNT